MKGMKGATGGGLLIVEDRVREATHLRMMRRRLLSVIVYYNFKCLVSVKCNFSHVYINFWVLSRYKSDFKCGFYLKFVLTNQY